MTVTYEEEAEKIAGRLGWEPTPSVILALVTGMVAVNTKAKWNALGAMQFQPGAVAFGDAIELPGGIDLHIWSYPDESTGLEAIYETVNQSTPEFGNLRKVGFNPNSDAEQIIDAFCQSWCGGNRLWLDTLGEVTDEQEHYFSLTYPGSQSAPPVVPAGTTPQGAAAAVEHGEILPPPALVPSAPAKKPAAKKTVAKKTVAKKTVAPRR